METTLIERESGERIRAVDINDEMRSAYLDYAMSVIVARALPDARDGLKPVQRRILYAMYDMGLKPTTPYKKSARIVGEVLGKYHPHGDSAVYEAMARMAQPFSLRYPLVDGQGNFGSIDGDSPAAMRYTEARLAPLAMEMLADIDKETVDWTDNFDGTLREPIVLPARLPNLLVNGASGIAVGMATNIPPHNLGEVIAALRFLLEQWHEQEEIGVEELMHFIPGPDFPTGGLVMGREAIVQAYATGRGKLTVRAVAHVEAMRGGRHRIVITEIPYQVNKSALLERIAALVRSGKLAGIADLRDESDRHGLSIVIELKRGVQPRKTLNRLYKYTPLQTTFGVQLLALVEGRPRLLSLKQLLLLFLRHRIRVIVRRTAYELSQAEARAHIIAGLLIALDHLDEVIATIRASSTVEVAKARLMERFELSAVQAQAILDMPLRRLTGLERQKLVDEYEALQLKITDYRAILASPERQRDVVDGELAALSEHYADDRRTRLIAQGAREMQDEDFVHEERVLIPITRRGYIKRVPSKSYRAQGRGGRGVIGMTTRDEDEVVQLISASTLETLLFFTDRGKVYSERVYQIPAADRVAKGSLISGILALESDEHVTAVVPITDFSAEGYLMMLTRRGRAKRVPLSEFSAIRSSGLIAIALEEGDELGWVRLTGGTDEMIIVTAQGRALRFPEKSVRPMGRTARGVRAITLRPGDHLAAAEVIEEGGSLLIVSLYGYGKRTPLDTFPTRNRGGQGVIAYKPTPRTGPVIAARVVQPTDEITLISENGIILRTRVKQISQMGRTARGVHLMDLKAGDAISAVARLRQKKEGQ